MNKIKKILVLSLSFSIYLRYFLINLFKQPNNAGNVTINQTLESTFDNKLSDEIFLGIDQLREEYNIPSLQVSFINKDRKYFNCCTGFSNIENRNKVSLNSTYYLGSITKLYTHAIILKLIQDHILSMDDCVLKYIDISPNGKKVTIKHLLFHTSGLFDPLSSGEDFKTIFLKKKWTNEKFINIVKTKKPYFTAGKKRKYSNIGYILLGIIAEKVAGMTYSSLLSKYFLNHFNLSNTYYASQGVIPQNLCTGYDKDIYKLGKFGLTANIDYYPIYLPTASLSSGGVIASASDVCKFIFYLFENDQLNNHMKSRLRIFFSHINKFGNTKLRTRWGYIVGYHNFCGYSANRQCYIVILSNLSYSKISTKLITKIFHLLEINDVI